MRVLLLIASLLFICNITNAQQASFHSLHDATEELFTGQTTGSSRIFRLPLNQIEVYSYEVSSREKKLLVQTTSTTTGDSARGEITLTASEIIITAHRQGSSLSARYRSNGSNQTPANVFIPQTNDPVLVLQALSYDLIQGFYGHREYSTNSIHPLFNLPQSAWLNAGFYQDGKFLLKNIGNNQFWKNGTQRIGCKIFASDHPSTMMQIEAISASQKTSYRVSYFGFGTLVVFLDPGDQKSRFSLALLLSATTPDQLPYLSWSVE